MRKKQQASMVGGGRTVTPDEAEEIAARLYTRKPERPQARCSTVSSWLQCKLCLATFRCSRHGCRPFTRKVP